MSRFSILLGSAPEDFRQKKLEDMFDFLDSKRNAGDSVVTFANGISEMMLEMVLDNSLKQLSNSSHSELVSESIKEILSEDAKQQVQDGNDVQVQDGNINNSNSILLYICTLQPVGESEKTIWLGGEEIRRDVIRHYQELAKECGIDMQVVFDSDSELLNEEKLGWEKVDSLEHCESISESVNKQPLNQAQSDVSFGGAR